MNPNRPTPRHNQITNQFVIIKMTKLKNTKSSKSETYIFLLLFIYKYIDNCMYIVESISKLSHVQLYRKWKITLLDIGHSDCRVSFVVQLVKNLPAVWETWVKSLDWEDTLEMGKATHYSTLTWRIPWTIHPLPTTQEKTLHMDITRWSTPTSD